MTGSAERKARQEEADYRTPVVICLLVLAWYLWGTYQRNFDWQSEKTLWTDVVQKSPMKPRPRISLGSVYLSEQRYDDAIREFDTALQLAQSLPPQSLQESERTYIRQSAGTDMVLALIQLGKFDKAQEVAAPLWKEFPGLPGIGASLAAIALQKGQFQAAIAIIDESLKAIDDRRWGTVSETDNQGYLYWNKAEALKQIAGCEAAMPFYHKAANVDPDLHVPPCP